MKTRICICIMLLASCSMRMSAQALTMQLPSGRSDSHLPKTSSPQPGQIAVESRPTPEISSNASEPSTSQIPIAVPITPPQTGIPVTIRAAEQKKQGSIYDLRGGVEIIYKSYVVRADSIQYNATTGEVTAAGHLLLTGGPDNEEISASHGVIHLEAQTGHFYDVTGSIGLEHGITQTVYTTANPLTVTARELIKAGPEQYAVVGGSMTSCRLPKPHWRIVAQRIEVKDDIAKAWNSNFRLWGYPILYLPYVTHPVNASGRQSGFLIPELQTGSAIKGTVIGVSYYWAINRSMDLSLGLQYYSLRGFGQSAEFRYRGQGNNFIHGTYKGLEDKEGQGGQDTFVTGRRDFTPYTRGVIYAEYLSSYAFRQVFSENFSQAVSSEIKSWGFLTHAKNGMAETFDMERYQNFASSAPDDQIRILHLPKLEFDLLDHRLGNTPLLAGGSASLSLLSRSEPYYRSHNVGRTDLFPSISIPWIADGWTFRPTIRVRDTFYSHSQILNPIPFPPPPPPLPPALPGEDAVPVAANASLNRKAVEADMQILPPILERNFRSPYLASHWGVALRHTIEPEIRYRYVAGINRFNQAPRFDPADLYSDTNEVEYGLTQRLFLKRLHPKPCSEKHLIGPVRKNGCETNFHPQITWFVGQKYFIDPSFGGAVVTGRRNVFSTTLDLSGIAYMTSPRDLSPVTSRLRIHPSQNVDLEWDLDYDTKQGRVAASNVFANYRKGNFFSSFGSALLNAVGETPVAPQQPPSVVNYDQLQFLAGYGGLTKPGLSGALSGGVDLNLHSLEYTAVQATYNFDCCGFTAEYRRFNLGPIRHESQETFSFTLAGVGTAGNLKRAQRLF